MTEQRFTYLNTKGWNKDGFLNTMNGLNKKNEKLKKENKQLKKELDQFYLLIGRGDWSGLVDLIKGDMND